MQTLPLFLIAHGFLSGDVDHATAFNPALNGLHFLISQETFTHTNVPKYNLSRGSRPSFKRFSTSGNDQDNEFLRNAGSIGSSEGQRSVWLVDDEESLRLAIGSYLKEYGFSIRVFHSALAALDALQLPLPDGGNDNKSHETIAASVDLPDAIVSDIMMPEMNGVEFCTYLRSVPQTRSIPLILLTAKGQTADRIEGYNAGADSYISKPFDAQELVTILEGCIARRDFLRGDDTGNIGDGTVVGLNEQTSGTVSMAVSDLRRDLEEIRHLILENNSNEDSMRPLLPSYENQMVNQDDYGKGSDSFLTPQETEVLELLCEGYMNKEIAAELQYSTNWVEKHLTVMYRKTGCANRTELVRWAVANDYVEF